MIITSSISWLGNNFCYKFWELIIIIIARETTQETI